LSCWWWRWFIVLLVLLLVCSNIGATCVSSCYLCCWFIMLLVLVIYCDVINTHLNHSPYVVVFFFVNNCYFHWMCVDKYYCHCHRSTSGKLVLHYVVVHLPLPSTLHHHLPPLMLLLFHHVDGVATSSIMLHVPQWSTTLAHCLV